MKPKETIEIFYLAFAKRDYLTMISCYHKDVRFYDPVFEDLNYEQVSSMWKMLLNKKNSTLKISHSNIETTAFSTECKWIAIYNYGPKKRKVVNRVTANFEFLDGKIINHKDNFSLWKWSSQALGFVGIVLGWTSFVKSKIRKTAKKTLKNSL